MILILLFIQEKPDFLSLRYVSRPRLQRQAIYAHPNFKSQPEQPEDADSCCQICTPAIPNEPLELLKNNFGIRRVSDKIIVVRLSICHPCHICKNGCSWGVKMIKAMYLGLLMPGLLAAAGDKS